MNTLTIVRRSSRRTHIVIGLANPFSVISVCGQQIPARGSGGVSISLAGGATERLVSFLRREFNDDACCKRCTGASALIIALYRSRDTGRRTA